MPATPGPLGAKREEIRNRITRCSRRRKVRSVYMGYIKQGGGGGGETTLHHRRHRDMRGVEHGETAVLVWCGAYRDLDNGSGMVVAK